jgi:hypothetical protein
MFESYGYTYVVNFQIYSPDDSKKSFTTTFVIYSSYQINRLYSHDNNMPIKSGIGTNTFRITTHGEKHLKGDPVINVMKRELRSFFKWGGRDYYAAPKEWKIALTTIDKKMALIMEKGSTHYTFMGQRTKKENLLQALSRFIYRSCFEKDPVKLLEYIMKLITLPENVAYVLENRTPYHYFDVENRKKIECRLNTQLISPTEAALEISDGIWANIDIDDLDIMVNYFYHEHSRAKTWANTTPKKLWTKLMGEEPSEAALELMEEFLVQNRTSDMVENRAKELMNSLEVKYPDRIKILDYTNNRNNKYKVMLVRGKLCDWVIINSTYKTDTQKVKTYVFISDEAMPIKADKDFDTKLVGRFNGPICIDNIHANSSLGDQYAARALALLNDNVTVKLVNTIGRYIPTKVMNGEVKSRFTVDWEFMGDLDYNWDTVIS